MEKMGNALKRHLKSLDAENGTITKIEYIEPISSEKIPEDMRRQPNEAYLFTAYVKGTWAYGDSYRIYNMDDTLKCYFSKDKAFLRMDDDKAR